MKQELKNWVQISIVLSVLLIAAVKLTATAETSAKMYNGARISVGMTNR